MVSHQQLWFLQQAEDCGDKVVVPDGAKKSLTVYSLDGKLIKNIPCPNISTGGHKAMAVCGDNSVVVSDRERESVFKVDIDSGEVKWTSKHVTAPQGVVCYKDRYVLVSSCNTDTKIWILDVDTGNFTIWLYHMFFVAGKLSAFVALTIQVMLTRAIIIFEMLHFSYSYVFKPGIVALWVKVLLCKSNTFFFFERERENLQHLSFFFKNKLLLNHHF